MTPSTNKKYSFSYHNDIKCDKNKIRKSANPQNLDEIMNNKEIKDLLYNYEMKRKTINTSVKPSNKPNIIIEDKTKKEKKKRYYQKRKRGKKQRE